MSHPVLRTYAYQRARLIVLRRDPDCTVKGPGCTGVSTQTDHYPPLAIVLEQLGDSPEFRRHACDPNNMRGACAHCNTSLGGSLGRARTKVKRSKRSPIAAARRSRDW